MCGRRSRGLVHPADGLDRVERRPDGAVADRVEVELESGRVERGGNHASQALRVDEVDPGVGGGVTRGVQVRLQQGPGEVLENAVEHQLDGGGPQPVEGGGAARILEPRDLLEPRVPVPPEGQRGPQGERTVGSRGRDRREGARPSPMRR